jgi:hypothetical protein
MNQRSRNYVYRGLPTSLVFVVAAFVVAAITASCALAGQDASTPAIVESTQVIGQVRGADETQTEQVLLMTPSPGPGTQKPPLPTMLPGPTAFLPDPLGTPLGAGFTTHGSTPYFSQRYYLENLWFEDLDAGNRRLFVGVGSMGLPGASVPTDQGVVVVAEAKWINGSVVFLAGAHGEYQTASAAGSLHIVDAVGARLVLQSSNGTTFYFDVPSRRYVDSLDAAPPPTATEPVDPTSIPTYAPPTPGPPATGYPEASTPTVLPAPTAYESVSTTAAP